MKLRQNRYLGKIIIEETALVALVTVCLANSGEEVSNNNNEVPKQKIEQTELFYPNLTSVDFMEEQEEIRNEILYGELEEVAILVQAEAGNQDDLGKRYVADTAFNRIDDPAFPDTIEGVVYQIDPVQFSTTVDGGVEKAGYTITEDVFKIVLEEYEQRTNSDIVYFRTDKYSECGHPAFKHGDHYFSTR